MSELMIKYDDLRRYWEKRHVGSVPIEHIKAMPTIEAEPVRQGRWIPYMVGRENGFTNVFVCSECGKSVRFIMSHEQCPYDGCPYCFARMNGGTKE